MGNVYKQVIAIIIVMNLCPTPVHAVNLSNSILDGIYSPQFATDEIWNATKGAVQLDLNDGFSSIVIRDVLLGNFTASADPNTKKNIFMGLSYLNTSSFDSCLLQLTNIDTVEKFKPFPYLDAVEVPITGISYYQSLLTHSQTAVGETMTMNQILGFKLDGTNKSYYGVTIIPTILEDKIRTIIENYTNWALAEKSCVTHVSENANGGLDIKTWYYNVPIVFQDVYTVNNLLGNLDNLSASEVPIIGLLNNTIIEWSIFPSTGSLYGYEATMNVDSGNLEALIVPEDRFPANQSWSHAYKDRFDYEFSVPGYGTYKLIDVNIAIYLSTNIQTRLSLLALDFALVEVSSSHTFADCVFEASDSALSWNTKNVPFTKTLLEGYDIWYDGNMSYYPVVVNSNLTESSFFNQNHENTFVDAYRTVLDSFLKVESPLLASYARLYLRTTYQLADFDFGKGYTTLAYNFGTWSSTAIHWTRHQLFIEKIVVNTSTDGKYSSWFWLSGVIALLSAPLLTHRRRNIRLV